MELNIDFSIFDTPITAYGNVTGLVDFQSMPKIGDEISLLSRHFRVISVTPVTFDGSKSIVIGFDDVVLKSRGDAKEFATRMERELGLFCAEYHPE